MLRAIAHPTRLAVLRSLDGRKLSMSELADEFGVSIQNIRHHVIYLRRAGLVREAGTSQTGNVSTTYWTSSGWVDQIRQVLPHEVVGRASG